MFNPEQLLGQLLKSGLGGGFGRGKKRNRGGSLLGGMSTGAKAQIGMGLLGVAIAAYEHFTKASQSSGLSPSPSSSPLPTPAQTPHSLAPMPRTSLESPASAESARRADAMLLVQAMVAAAAADGDVDAEERATMLRRAHEAGFDDETKRFLEAELSQPKSLAVIASSTRADLVTDVYAASCAAITADTDAERAYLDTLGKRLGLSDQARAEVHRQLELA